MIVLSLFDGMGCGYEALERAGIPVTKYYASEIDKYAIKIANKNHPDIIQLGDINGWHDWDIEAPDLIMGGSPCFTSGTLIICDNKIKPIEEVKIGDKVLTHTGKYKRVLKTGSDVKEIYTLNAQGGVPVYSTANHPFYTRKRKRVWNKERRCHEWFFTNPKWTELNNITEDHYVATPIIIIEDNPLNLTHEECYILGLYMGDGHTRKDYRQDENRPKDRYWQLILSIGSHEVESLKERINENNFLCYKHTNSVHRFVFSNKRLVEIAEKHIGCGSKNKSVSKTILNLPKPLLESFLLGYEFSDGSERGSVFRATSISRNLVNTVSLVVAKLYKTTCCIEFTKRPEKTTIEGRVVNQSDTWTISYRKNHTKQSRAWVIDDTVWNPVKIVKKKEDIDTVYNLEVEDDNSYVADGRVVHNCQGFSFAGKQLAFDDPRSALLFKMVDILNWYNPRFRLLENVKMKKDYRDIISDYMGVESFFINSNLVSAQNRPRWYWFNWDVDLPEDKNILLDDILEEEVSEEYLMSEGWCKWWDGKGEFQLKKKYSSLNADKAITLTARQYASWNGNFVSAFALTERRTEEAKRIRREHKKLYGTDYSPRRGKELVPREDGKMNCLTATYSTKEHTLIDSRLNYRKLTPIECERLQTLSDRYTEGVSDAQRYKMLGSGWTVEVLTHIFKGMPYE